MRRPLPTITLAVWLLLLCVATVSAQYTFVTVDYPGAVWTVPSAINNAGQIVGYYKDSSGIRHGFLLNAGVYSTIDCPSPYTQGSAATGINNLGQIVGRCHTSASTPYGTTRSFVLDAGALTFLPDFPGSYAGASTLAEDINDRGQIVGWYAESCLCNAHGFLLDGGVFTSLNAPGYPMTAAYGINNLGRIVGVTQSVWGNSPAHGLSFDGSVFLTIDPAASVSTEVDAVGDANAVVGVYYDAHLVQHGFVYDGAGRFALVEPPDATSSGVQGLNANGQLVGSWVDSVGVVHGYLATPQPNAPTTHTSSAKRRSAAVMSNR